MNASLRRLLHLACEAVSEMLISKLNASLRRLLRLAREAVSDMSSSKLVSQESQGDMPSPQAMIVFCDTQEFWPACEKMAQEMSQKQAALEALSSVDIDKYADEDADTQPIELYSNVNVNVNVDSELADPDADTQPAGEMK